jgi:hypothetical protein
MEKSMTRAKYQWGATQYLLSFAPYESRLYKEKYPWRSLASIGARLGNLVGMQFRFLTVKNPIKNTTDRIIIRVI